MYKEIILVLEQRTDIPARLQFACKFAAMHSAKLIALYVHELDLSVAGFLPSTHINISALRDAHDRDLARSFNARDEFQRMAAEAMIESEWRTTDNLSASHVANIARRADLLLFGAHDGLDRMGDITLNVPAVILESGCPAIILPEIPQPQLPFRRILVAWKASRESRRAVHDALPLLQSAEKVVIATVREADDTFGMDSANDIADYLSTHGVHCSVEILDDSGSDAGSAILMEAAKIDANLIVAGFYGRARLTEFILGGVSRTLLNQVKVPLLLSH